MSRITTQSINNSINRKSNDWIAACLSIHGTCPAKLEYRNIGFLGKQWPSYGYGGQYHILCDTLLVPT